MQRKGTRLFTMMLCTIVLSSANAQVIRGVMSVNQAHMS